MGADWIGGYVELSKTREEALAALENMSDYLLLQTMKDRDIDPYRWEDEEGVFDIDAFRESCRSAVNDCYDAAEGKRRDGTGWLIYGKVYAVSGGDSWGDPPTDLCESIWLVEELCVTS